MSSRRWEGSWDVLSISAWSCCDVFLRIPFGGGRWDAIVENGGGLVMGSSLRVFQWSLGTIARFIGCLRIVERLTGRYQVAE